MKTFTKNFKNNEKKLEEFNKEIEDITTIAQDKFAHELENIAYDSVQKFRSLLAKELNSIFNNIHSQNVNLLKSSLVEYAISSNFINKKGETALELIHKSVNSSIFPLQHNPTHSQIYEIFGRCCKEIVFFR